MITMQLYMASSKKRAAPGESEEDFSLCVRLGSKRQLKLTMAGHTTVSDLVSKVLSNYRQQFIPEHMFGIRYFKKRTHTLKKPKLAGKSSSASSPSEFFDAGTQLTSLASNNVIPELVFLLRLDHSDSEALDFSWTEAFAQRTFEWFCIRTLNIPSTSLSKLKSATGFESIASQLALWSPDVVCELADAASASGQGHPTSQMRRFMEQGIEHEPLIVALGAALLFSCCADELKVYTPGILVGHSRVAGACASVLITVF